MASQSSHLFVWHFRDLNHSDFHIYNRGVLLVLIFFLLIFIFSIFFFYAHRVCFKRGLPTTTTRVRTTNISLSSSSLPQAHDHRSLGLDAATIGSLPVSLHRSAAIANPNAVESVATNIGIIECCICLGVFEEDEKVKVLPKCHHTFHSECVDEWLSIHSSCPLCRLSLPSINSP